jgi:hypothetical protein
MLEFRFREFFFELVEKHALKKTLTMVEYLCI